MLILGYAAEFTHVTANGEDSSVRSIILYKSFPLVGAGLGQTLKIGYFNVLSGGWGLILFMCFAQSIATNGRWGSIALYMYCPTLAPVFSLLPD